MKKRILLMCSLTAALSITSWGQNPLKSLQNAPTVAFTEALPNHSRSLEKTTLCRDTLQYAYAKEVLLYTTPAPVLNVFTLWQSDNEGITQTYLLNGGSVNVTGVEFYARRNASSPAATATVSVSLYNVNATYMPTTLITSTTMNISSTAATWYSVNFPTPATLTSNYAIVIELTNANPNARLDIVTNNQTGGQPYDENLSAFRSADAASYPGSSGNWVTVPTAMPGYNFEPIVGAIVNYSLTASYTTAPTSVCAGTPVTFTSTSTPTAPIASRMFNLNVFSTFFGLTATDSTYAYNLDNGQPFLYGNPSTTYTYNTPGTYDPELGIFGGLLYTCVDVASTPLTINAVPAAPTVTPGGATTFCAGGNVVLTSSAATGNTWSTGATTQAITVNSAGTYTVTATATGCTSPASAATTITVNPLDNATFTYPTNSICDGAPNQTPTTSVAGTFAATPTGLVFTSTSTGVIDVANSTDGSYSVTYTTSGTCPNTSTQTIVISGAPDATFTYAQSTYCTNGTNPSPVYPTGASAGAFSSAAGLVINASTGEINLASSTAGAYTVTNAIAANGSCPADTKMFSVTIAPTPTAVVSGGGTQCGTGSFPVNIALTGAGPWNVTYTDGTTPTTVTGATTSPIVINATANGTYTVSNVTMGGCSAVGTGTASVVFHTNPTVTFTPVGTVCDNASPVTLVGSPLGGSFSGSTGVSGSTFDPNGLTPGSITLTYNYTDANNCSGSATSIVTLNAAPVATLGAFTDVCVQAASFALSGGLPAGGTYSGTGVTAGNFSPTAAGVGPETISYTVTANGCTDVAAQTITVEDCAGIVEAVDFGLEIYPNPASSVVTIKTGKDVTFSMISQDGKVVYPAASLSMDTETHLEVSHLARGIYFLHFNGTQGNLVQKVILK